MSVNLKLVGPASFSRPSLLSRRVVRGETVRDVPDAVADKLLALGTGTDDDFKPYFREVTERPTSRTRRAAAPAPIPQDATDEDPNEGLTPAQIAAMNGGDEDEGDEEGDETEAAAAGKPAKQRRSRAKASQ